MKQLFRSKIIICVIICLVMISSITKSTSASGSNGGTVSSTTASSVTTAPTSTSAETSQASSKEVTVVTPAITEPVKAANDNTQTFVKKGNGDNQTVSENRNDLKSDNNNSDNKQINPMDKLLMISMILMIVLILMCSAIIIINILIMKKFGLELSIIQDRFECIMSSINGLPMKYDINDLEDSLRHNIGSLRDTVNDAVKLSRQNYEETRQKQDNSTYDSRNMMPDEKQYHVNVDAPEVKSKSQFFLEQYNKYLEDEIKLNDFLAEYSQEDVIIMRIDMSNNREVKFISSGNQNGHLQVFNKSLGNSMYSIAVLNKKEFSAFNNTTTLDMIRDVFDITGSSDFAKGHVTCIEPAQVQKVQGNMYKIIKKGVYNIQ